MRFLKTFENLMQCFLLADLKNDFKKKVPHHRMFEIEFYNILQKHEK